MRKLLFLLLVLMTCVRSLYGQLCPGGGIDFSTAAMFDPGWIYGCNTGTSCNGGVAFDNRVACLPITSLDACAPAPSCTMPARTASNVWYKFFASSTNAVISCFQNTSLVLGVQAFSGGPLCGSLTELGCALSSGPSSGVQLSLSNLHIGTLYYFRVFGSATPVSQRTGLYCFCGSTGLNNFIILPVIFNQLSAQVANNTVGIDWSVTNSNAIKSFEIQRSANGNSFSTIGVVEPGENELSTAYHYTDNNPTAPVNYYRIKYTYKDEHSAFSSLLSAMVSYTRQYRLLSDGNTLQVMVDKPGTIYIYSSAGQLLRKWPIAAGTSTTLLKGMKTGIYLAQWDQTGTVQKFYVAR
ncbi:MAG: hypothetical protein QM726_11180 [Chitinophagaceae bacterium]